MPDCPRALDTLCVRQKGFLLLYTILAKPSRKEAGATLYGLAATKLYGLAHARPRRRREVIPGCTYSHGEARALRGMLAAGSVTPGFLREILDETPRAVALPPVRIYARRLSHHRPIRMRRTD